MWTNYCEVLKEGLKLSTLLSGLVLSRSKRSVLVAGKTDAKSAEIVNIFGFMRGTSRFVT